MSSLSSLPSRYFLQFLCLPQGHTHPWCIFIKKRTGPFPAFRTRQQARAFPPHAPRVVSSPLPPPPNPAVVLNYSHQAIPYLGNNRDEPLLILPRFQTELLCFLCELGVSRAAKVSPPNPGRRSSRPRGLRQPPPCRGPSGVRRPEGMPGSLPHTPPPLVLCSSTDSSTPVWSRL